MLNKDEYNQEEYNDYYRQETEGAEIGNSDEKGGLMSKLIILLILLALSIAGYFGYKAMNNSAITDSDSSLKVSEDASLPQSVQDKPSKVVIMEAPEDTNEDTTKDSLTKDTTNIKNTNQIEAVPNVQSTITSEVTKAVETQGKMSPEEVAAVVAAVATVAEGCCVGGWTAVIATGQRLCLCWWTPFVTHLLVGHTHFQTCPHP